VKRFFLLWNTGKEGLFSCKWSNSPDLWVAKVDRYGGNMAWFWRRQWDRSTF